MNFAITTLAIAAVILMATAVITWPRRRTAHWIVPFLGLATAVSIWLIGYALELSVVALEEKIFWAQVQYIGITFTPVAWIIFAYQFLNQKARNLKVIFLLLSILPITTIIIAFTNDQHGLLWTQNLLDESGPMPMLSNSYGSWFWIHSAYSYLLIVSGIGLFFRTIKLYPNPFRRQSIILILAAATPLLGNALYLARLSPIQQFDLTPFAFAVSTLLIVWGVVRLDLFDIIPIARRMIVESLPDGIILLDMQDRILDINEMGRRLISPNNKQIVGQALADLPSEIAQKAALYNHKLEVDDEIAAQNNGEVHHFNIRIRPFFITGPHPRARILILRDISRRIAAEAGIWQRNLELQQLITEAQTARETAEKANKAKSELLAKVSHDLRTPLGAILGHAEMLQESVYGPVTEEQSRSLHRIIENSGYLNEQVKDLLDLSRIGAGTLDIQLYEFNLEDALTQVQTRLKPVAAAKDLDLIIDVSSTLPKRLIGNSIRLQQILVNLGMNAIKFTESGQISISIDRQGTERWSIQISDTGNGIPKDQLSNIFQPFHQLESSMIRGQGGIGLGLTIVQELTYALGGTIEVESQLDVGSTFTVTLPFYPIANPESDVKNVRTI